VLLQKRMNWILMAKFVIDAWAWMEYLNGSAKGKAVHDLTQNEDNEVFTSAVSLAEVLSKVLRQGKDQTIAREALCQLSKIVVADEALASRAGELHAKIKRRTPNFSLGDSFVLATASIVNATVITGDPDFKGVAGVKFI